MIKRQNVEQQTVYVARESTKSPLLHLVLVVDTMPWHESGGRYHLYTRRYSSGGVSKKNGFLVLQHTCYWNQLLAAPEAATRAAFILQRAALDVRADQLAVVGQEHLPTDQPGFEWGLATPRLLMCAWSDYTHDWGPAETYVREQVGDLEARRLVPDHGTGEPFFIMPLSRLAETLMRLEAERST